MHFARKAQSGSDTTREATDAIKTTSAFGSTSVKGDRNSIWNTLASLSKHNTKQLDNIANTKTPFDTFWFRSGLHDLRRRLSIVLCLWLATVRFARPAPRETNCAKRCLQNTANTEVVSNLAQPRLNLAGNQPKSYFKMI